jgi:ABC-type branched-subunit amino acid transport system substrate-binding protein
VLSLFFFDHVVAAQTSKAAISSYPKIILKKSKKSNSFAVCSVYPLAGNDAVIGEQLLIGAKNFIKGLKPIEREEEGHKKIMIQHLANNKEINDSAYKEMKKLKKKTPIVVGLLGIDTMLSLLPLVKKKEITVLFPSIDAIDLRKQLFENIVYFRPSVEQEIRALINYSVEVKFKKNIAVFYEASEWGEDCLKILKDILKEHDLKPVVTAAYPEGTIYVSNAVATISKKSPNAVFCICKPRPGYNFIKNGMNSGLHKCLFLGLSYLNPIQLILKNARGLDLVVSAVVPDPNKSALAITKEYKKSMGADEANSPFYFESFINYAIFADVIKQIQGRITIEKIIKIIESTKNYDFKGIKLNFDSATRTLSNTVWINPGIDQSWIAASEMLKQSDANKDDDNKEKVKNKKLLE